MGKTGAKVMFIEVINEDLGFLESQYKSTAAKSQDYSSRSLTSSVSIHLLEQCMFRIIRGNKNQPLYIVL